MTTFLDVLLIWLSGLLGRTDDTLIEELTKAFCQGIRNWNKLDESDWAVLVISMPGLAHNIR